MQISLIVAMGLHRQIGIENRIPWKLSADLKNFKKLTMGHTLVMGRKTYESLGRPLPGRKTFVLSRECKISFENCKSVASLQEAIGLAKNSGETELFIAGGSEVYKQGLPIVQRIYLSRVDYDGAADTYFPEFSTEAWKKTHSEKFEKIEGSPAWTFEIWDR